MWQPCACVCAGAAPPAILDATYRDGVLAGAAAAQQRQAQTRLCGRADRPPPRLRRLVEPPLPEHLGPFSAGWEKRHYPRWSRVSWKTWHLRALPWSALAPLRLLQRHATHWAQHARARSCSTPCVCSAESPVQGVRACSGCFPSEIDLASFFGVDLHVITVFRGWLVATPWFTSLWRQPAGGVQTMPPYLIRVRDASLPGSLRFLALVSS